MLQKEYSKIFCDINPPLTATQAQVEASRCYYCYDAPCIQACPTQIDIPSFIRKISNGNLRGAAKDILSENIMGGTCARACPVETLCQAACVREKAESKPVAIGLLQRYATDQLFNGEFFKGDSSRAGESFFHRAKSNGLKIAVIGAGPSGLSCAHRLAVLGYDVTVFEAKDKAGGLNEYGLAPYKVTDNFVQREIDFILGVGGIQIRHGQVLGKNLTLDQLRADYSAVYISIGLGRVNALGIEGEDLQGVFEAAPFIERIRQTRDLSTLPVGRNVLVIGGGNTAIDISIQMKRLGAEFVTLVYRRGEEQMGATPPERELAQKNGVLIKTWAKPLRILGDGKQVQGVLFQYTELKESGTLEGTGSRLQLPADQVFKAIGQTLCQESFSGSSEIPKISSGKLVVDADLRTSLPGVYSGGDCVDWGEDLTVTSVQQGKLAAQAIDRKFNPNG